MSCENYYQNCPTWESEGGKWKLDNTIWQGEYSTNGLSITLNGVPGIQAIVSWVTPPSPISASLIITVQKSSLSPKPLIGSTITFNGNIYTVDAVFDKHNLYAIWLQ